jgi:hypothetical protein
MEKYATDVEAEIVILQIGSIGESRTDLYQGKLVQHQPPNSKRSSESGDIHKSRQQ